ncbi:hypothetical protein [Pseudoalteromonas ruthenica]|uniref:hypothetical protein n=1 Tax=Pseudoalteromonas ruthenica TaxID=151081 RepID=UPI00110AE6C8|nr:hypothetical protein [Pseudoalteromonas ruthenica]TMP23768.1 hypothetical protein CWC06_09445 [Pseudoalteromonas ruthenica]
MITRRIVFTFFAVLAVSGLAYKAYSHYTWLVEEKQRLTKANKQLTEQVDSLVLTVHEAERDKEALRADAKYQEQLFNSWASSLTVELERKATVDSELAEVLTNEDNAKWHDSPLPGDVSGLLSNATTPKSSDDN